MARFWWSAYQKLELVELQIRDIFIQCLEFNKAIIKLTLAGHELMYDSRLGASHLARYLKAHMQHASVE